MCDHDDVHFTFWSCTGRWKDKETGETEYCNYAEPMRWPEGPWDSKVCPKCGSDMSPNY